MREFADRWILPIAGRMVTRCCVDDAISIELSNAGRAEATLRIGGAFDLQPRLPHKKPWRLHPERGAIALAPALSLLGLTVESATAYKDGTLEVAFSDGSRLRVAPDPDYEAWEFAGSHGAKAVALPGGDVAIWRPAA